MITIRATWRDGRVILEEPADWAEGVHLLVAEREAPVRPITQGMSEDEQGETPEEIERWIAETDAIPPLVLTPEEESDLFSWREKSRRFNLQAVERQMAEGLLP